ncbi:MAG: lysylphosphatidylglycerol synthase transmembrane domain-containing protein [Acidobacteriota bacterium]
MKLALNLALSFVMLALCVWLVWPDHATRQQVGHAIEQLHWSAFAPYLFGYLGLLVVVHLCRSLRWNNLLAPLGVKIKAGPMLALQSVGFLTILALPARLGEFVRPGLIRKHGVSASAALGMVAVERIVDGLLVSLFVFGAFFALRGPDAPSWMMPTAYAALGVFALALAFLVAAMRRPAATVKFCLTISMLPRLSPRFALVVEEKLLEMIRGLDILKDQRNLGVFLTWSIVYWAGNGLGVWVLARGFHAIDPAFDLSVLGAFATMGLVAVGITLPNSPGLVGQFQWFTLLGLSLYLHGAADKASTLYPTAFAFANMHYGLQVIWYVLMGTLGLLSPWVSFADLRAARARSLPHGAKTGADTAR